MNNRKANRIIPVNFMLSLPTDAGNYREICPRCGGGSKSEKSLAITVNESLNTSWYCHRASCDFKGTDYHVPNADRSKCSTVAEQVVFSNTSPEKKPGYKAHAIRDNVGDVKGWHYYTKDKTVDIPKSLNYFDEGWCGLHIPRRLTDNETLLVEDYKSSQDFCMYYPTVCLFGVHLNQAKVDYLIGCGIKYAIIALDADATTQAISLKKNWGIIQRILPLTKDLKDCSTRELINIASNLP